MKWRKAISVVCGFLGGSLPNEATWWSNEPMIGPLAGYRLEGEAELNPLPPLVMEFVGESTVPFRRVFFVIPHQVYPNGRNLRSRNVQSPPATIAFIPRIGRAPSSREAPNRERYASKISLANCFEPSTAPSEKYLTRHRKASHRLSFPPDSDTRRTFS